MAKKAATKPAPAKRKPRPKKPVVPAVVDPPKSKSSAWRSVVVNMIYTSACGFIGLAFGVLAAGGIEIGPGPIVRNDVLQQSYDSDRATQIAVLRELAAQTFDGTTDDGRRKAGEWFNAQRFRNRADDFGPYTDEVSEAIAANAEAELAKKLEEK